MEALGAFLGILFFLLVWFVSIMLHNQTEEINKQTKENIIQLETIKITDKRLELYCEILELFYTYDFLTIQDIMYIYPELKVGAICAIVQTLVKKNILIKELTRDKGRIFMLNTNKSLETVISEIFDIQEGE